MKNPFSRHVTILLGVALVWAALGSVVGFVAYGLNEPLLLWSAGAVMGVGVLSGAALFIGAMIVRAYSVVTLADACIVGALSFGTAAVVTEALLSRG